MRGRRGKGRNLGFNLYNLGTSFPSVTIGSITSRLGVVGRGGRKGGGRVVKRS